MNLADDAQRVREAAAFVLKLREESASEADILRWMQWCEADPRNQAAFNRARQLWTLSGALAGQVRDGELIAAAAVARSGWRAARMTRRAALASAAGIAGLALASLWLLQGPAGTPATLAVASSTHSQAARLADGSQVELAARSSVAVRFSEHARAVELEGGEAFFSVARDAKRPFVVSAGVVRVRAIGTAFNVRRAGERVVVTVTEGTVDVYRADGSAREALRVSPGSRVTWDEASADPVLASVNPSSALAWREGRLEYSGEPLAAVIADLNRYSSKPVTIRGEAARTLRVSGTLLTASGEEWLRALPAQFPVRLIEQKGAYVIESRDGK